MIRALVEQEESSCASGRAASARRPRRRRLGAPAARLGRKTLVCTIDPAPRLADALGVGGLGPEPRPVPAEACRALGIPERGRIATSPFASTPRGRSRGWSTSRWPTQRCAGGSSRTRSTAQITTSLTGSQEYAATLALYELARDGTYDLIVLDTPPTANALDFLDAPKRIAAAVSSPALSWFARPPEGDEGGGLRRLSLRRLRAGGALVLRRLAKLVGSRFLDDVGAFLIDFQHVLGGFLERAKAVDLLLRGPETAFLLVLVPAVAAVDEALYFHGRLRDAGVPLSAFIANRVQPAPGITDAVGLTQALRATPAFADLTDAALAEAAARLAPLAGTFAALHAGERRELARLGAQAPGTQITQIPLLDHDVDSLAELRVVGEALLAG